MIASGKDFYKAFSFFESKCFPNHQTWMICPKQRSSHHFQSIFSHRYNDASVSHAQNILVTAHSEGGTTLCQYWLSNLFTPSEYFSSIEWQTKRLPLSHLPVINADLPGFTQIHLFDLFDLQPPRLSVSISPNLSIHPLAHPTNSNPTLASLLTSFP